MNYQTMHTRVRRARGPAKNYPCVKGAELGVGEQARDWALIHGETGEDPWADFVPLCRSHHWKYDGGSFKGRVHSTDTKARMSAAKVGKVRTAEHRANLSAALKGRPGRVKSDDEKARISAAMMGNQNGRKQR